MFKNNKFVVLALLIAGGISVAQAQTIEEISLQAKAKQLLGPAALLNGSGQGTPAAAPAPVTPPRPAEGTPIGGASQEMVLTGIYQSPSATQAGISIDGAELFVGPGDPVINHWIVAAVSENQVILKKCGNVKHCETKILSYTNTR